MRDATKCLLVIRFSFGSLFLCASMKRKKPVSLIAFIKSPEFSQVFSVTAMNRQRYAFFLGKIIERAEIHLK